MDGDDEHDNVVGTLGVLSSKWRREEDFFSCFFKAFFPSLILLSHVALGLFEYLPLPQELKYVL